MKRGVLILLLCGVIGIAGCGDSEKAANQETVQETESSQKEMEGDFRSTTWGMSRDDIKKLEGDPIEENDTAALYDDEVANFPVYVLYTFDGDKLVNGTYSFQQEHTNKNLYYEDYKKLVDVYTEKYGEPYKQTENWNDDLYKDDPSDWGMAISAGHVDFFSFWKTGTTNITIRLYGDNFEISLVALYQDQNHESKTDTNGI